MGHAPGPLLMTRLLMYCDGVPRRMRFWLIVMFALFYQLSGGVYLAALSQMVGELAFLSEDVTMAGYCSLIGLNMIFPILFRWKFFLYTRQLFFVSSIGAIVCAVAAMYASVPWVLWLICLLAGYFKMMGMFGCMSTVQLNITPTRNFAVFFPVVYILVCGAIQLSGIMTAVVTYWFSWRYVYLIVIGLMIIVDGITYFMMKPDHRSGPFIPLKGIDWTGHLLWTAVSVVGTWIFTFGEHYDWWDSYQIWYATWLFIALLVVTVVHARYKKDPFISLKAFCYPATVSLLLMLFAIAVIESASHVLQPVFMNVVAGYDYFTMVNFNYPQLAGVVAGAILAYYSIVRLKWRLNTYFFVCFVLVTFYVLASYFLIDPAAEAWQFYIPLFALGMATIMMESGATYLLSQAIPFPHFFMNIAIIGFVRCGFGTSAAGAVVERLFAWALGKDMMLTSADVAAPAMSEQWFSQYFTAQNMMIAVKECLGYLALFGVAVSLIVLLSRYRTSVKRFVPKISAVAGWIRNSREVADPTLR